MNPSTRRPPPTRGLRKVGIVVLGLAAAIVAFGAFRIATAPAELQRGAPGWFDSVHAHGDATFAGTALLMVGAFLLFTGAALCVISSRRVHHAGFAMVRATAAAVSQGVNAGAGTDTAARLAKVDDLLAAGAITSTEHAEKRKAILAML